MFLTTNLLTQSLWRDEAFTALLIHHHPLDIIRLSAGDATPPLYYLLLHFWSNFFGDSEVALRSLSVIFFLATAGVMYFLGREINRRAGFITTLLTLTQPLLFYYAFEARAYSLMVLLTALTLYFYLRGKRWLTALSATALLYTHLFGLAVVAILALWSLYRRRTSWPTLLPLILILPWIPNYLSFAALAGGFLHPPSLMDLLGVLFALGSPILILVLPFLKELFREERFQLLVLLWAGPIVVTFLVSQFKPEFLDRYLIATVIPELLLLALIAGRRYATALLIAAAVIQAGASYWIFTHPEKELFPQLASYIRSHEEPGDVVIDGSSLTYFESSYYQLPAKIYSPKNDVPYYVGGVLIPPHDIETTLPQARRYWVIEISDPGGSLEAPLNLPSAGVTYFGKLKLTLYESKLAS